ncbi:MAG: hypothetical protein WA208_07645 [Thermoanaerobaculia bacterium]
MLKTAHDPMAKIASIILAASVPLVALAFWPLYLARPFASVDRYTHLHAVAGSLWLALLIAQPAAVHARRFALHRALGRISYGLAAAFVIAGILLSHHRLASMDDAKFAVEGFFHFLPFYATAVFVLAYGGGLWFRRTPAAHGRFMLCTAIPLIDPVLGRILGFYLPPFPNPWLYQVVTFGVATAVAGLLVFTYHGVPAAQRALKAFFVALVALELGWFAIAPTAAWLEVVRWFRRLPLT